MGSWFACNVNQHGNLPLFWLWSVLFPLPGKPQLVLPRPALLPSRCSSRLTAFIAIVIWIFLHELGAPSLRKMPFLDPKIFQRSRQRGIPTPEQKGGNWEPPILSWVQPPYPRAEGWELGTPTLSWVQPPPGAKFTPNPSLTTLSCICYTPWGLQASWKQGLCLSSLKHQSLASYRRFINSACELNSEILGVRILTQVLWHGHLLPLLGVWVVKSESKKKPLPAVNQLATKAKSFLIKIKSTKAHWLSLSALATKPCKKCSGLSLSHCVQDGKTLSRLTGSALCRSSTVTYISKHERKTEGRCDVHRANEGKIDLFRHVGASCVLTDVDGSGSFVGLRFVFSWAQLHIQL